MSDRERLLLEPAAVGETSGSRLIVVADGALHYIPFAALPVKGLEGSPVPLVALHELVSLPSAAVLREIRRADLWPAGINTMPTAVFEPLARSFLSWCRLNSRRTLVVSHDGTVYNYRKLLLEDPDLPMEPRLGLGEHVLMSI